MQKSTGGDKLPPKLVKCAASYTYKSLTVIINQSLKTANFPNNAKSAAVTPLDEGSLHKNYVVNFRPVGIVNCFPKISESVIKRQLVPFIENYISVFLSSYRSS